MDSYKVITELHETVTKAFQDALSQLNGNGGATYVPPTDADAPTRVAMFLTLIQRGVITENNFMVVAKEEFGYSRTPSFESKGWMTFKNGVARLTKDGNAEYLRRYGLLTPMRFHTIEQIAIVYHP